MSTQSNPGDVVLSVRDVTIEVRFGSGWRDAVRNISFELHAGEVTALVGESGSGKSLTALACMGLLPQSAVRVKSGEIELDGIQLVGRTESEMQRIRGQKVAMIFQEPMTALNPLIRVGIQIADVVRAHRKCSKKEARGRAAECLELVGIPAARMRAYPHELSGGMRQRVLIAMAVACEPAVLIADEPTTALDVTVQAQIIDLLGSMVDRFGMAMMFISHDFGVVADIADRVNVMLTGEIVERGGVLELFRDPQHDYTKSLMHMARGNWLSEEPITPGMVSDTDSVTLEGAAEVSGMDTDPDTAESDLILEVKG